MSEPAIRAGAHSLCDAYPHPFLGELQSRVVMTAMTRSFAGPGHLATPQMAEYYARRAAHGVGLVLTESIAVDPSGDGFPTAPRLHTTEQADSWRVVVEAVHAAGAPIAAQLLHCGRITHEDYTDGIQPVSSTDQRAGGINRRNGKPYGEPRRLPAGELPRIVDVHRHSARLALSAGFDLVELHLAHGYLADQFFDARVNDRSDEYGGSVENRCRFGLELALAMLDECGPERLMVRISPSRWMGGLYDWPDLDEMLARLIPAFDALGVRMLDISCARADYHATSGRIVRKVRPMWPHFLVAGASLPAAEAQAELDAGLLDMVTYGRWLIANCDLVERMRAGDPPRPYDESLLDVLA
jgi:N-ethylmaleimide reductase